MKKPSIKDIAKALRVSVTTVSFVLNGKGKEMRISDEVVQNILDFAEKIKYTPNQLAQGLRTGKTNIIVFMVEDISNHFFAKLARIIEIIAYKKGYKVIFCSNENDDKKTIQLLNVFKDRRVDGYIIIPSEGVESQIRDLIDENTPLVLFDRYFPGLKTNYVIIDNEYATYKGTQHLIENGFKNIGFITTDVKQIQMIDRMMGYMKAVREENLEQKILQIPYESLDTREGEIMLENFFKNSKKLDSVFFSTNYLTQKGLSTLKKKYPSKLHEWGILTFDDNEYFGIHTPSISAIAQPLEEIGEKLMEIILQKLGGKQDADKSVKQVTLKTNLKIRESSKAKI